MTFRTLHSDRSRHLVLRASGGEKLPEALAARLAEEGVSGGWLRASGVLSDVELRAFDARLGTLGATRRIAGPVHVLSLEGGIGMAAGEPSPSLRALLAREGDFGLETLAGEITSAYAIALEIFVTALDDVAVARSVDAATGIALLDPADGGARSPSMPVAVAPPAPVGAPPQVGAPPAPVAPPAPPPMATRASSAPAWSAAAEASAHAVQTIPNIPTERDPAWTSVAPSRATTTPAAQVGTPSAPATVQIPQRPTRAGLDLDTPTPEGGDVVEHFAFGRCEVVKSDGDRLHLRVPKDGRIREIALEMLRVTRLEDEGGRRRFKLERRL